MVEEVRECYKVMFDFLKFFVVKCLIDVFYYKKMLVLLKDISECIVKDNEVIIEVIVFKK